MLRWHILCWQLLWKSVLLKLVDLRGCKTTTITTITNDFVVRTQEEEILGFIMYVRFQRLHEQALRGGKRKKSLQLRHWNLNISIEKNRFEMLIGGYDISNDVITLFSRSFLLRADWRRSDSSVDGEPQGYWRWYSNSRVASSPSFFRPTARIAAESLLAG